MLTLAFLLIESIIGFSLLSIWLTLLMILRVLTREHRIMFPKGMDEVCSPGVKRKKLL